MERTEAHNFGKTLLTVEAAKQNNTLNSLMDISAWWKLPETQRENTLNFHCEDLWSKDRHETESHGAATPSRGHLCIENKPGKSQGEESERKGNFEVDQNVPQKNLAFRAVWGQQALDRAFFRLMEKSFSDSRISSFAFLSKKTKQLNKQFHKSLPKDKATF